MTSTSEPSRACRRRSPAGPAASPDAAAGRADQTAPGDIEATGRFGSGGVRILTESKQQIDLLLGAIRDDPERVLAARLQAMHRQREGTAQ